MTEPLKPVLRDETEHGKAYYLASDVDALLERFAGGGKVMQEPTKRVWMECSILAASIHYPECWDVAAYPELDDALNQLAACFKTTGCETCTLPLPAQQPVAPTPKEQGYVPLSDDGKSVFIDGFGEVPLAYPPMQQAPLPAAPAELLGNPEQLEPRQLPTNCRHCGGPDDVICGGQCRRATDAFADAAKAMHPVQEPETAVYIRKDQLQKAAQSAMLCEVTPEPRQDRIRIYTTPVHGKPLTREQDIAMREGHHISASDKYFAARFTLVTISHLKIFEAGFDRGWNAAHGITGDTK